MTEMTPEEMGEQLMELIENTLESWDEDDSLDIYLDGETLTADVDDLRNQLAIMTVATMEGTQEG